MIYLDPNQRTQTYVLNLNEKVADTAQGIVLPIEMMKQAVKQATYRAIMYKCLCRSAFNCKSFPHDHACIFLGEGARAVVGKHLGKEASLEEALAHIDRGAELGLIGQAMWVEVEANLFGIKKEEGVGHWLEICFCCPCCCGAFKLVRATNQMDVKGRFRSIGWKAHQTCTRCLKCAKRCPVAAISLKSNRLLIDEQACLGCGLCAAACPKGAIKLRLSAPLQGTIHDYFKNGGLDITI